MGAEMEIRCKGPQIIYRSAPDLGIAIPASTETQTLPREVCGGRDSCRGAVMFAISQPENVDVNEVLFRCTLVHRSFNDKVASSSRDGQPGLEHKISDTPE